MTDTIPEVEKLVKETHAITKKWYDESLEDRKKALGVNKGGIILLCGLMILLAAVIGFGVGYSMGWNAAVESITRKLILHAIGVDL